MNEKKSKELRRKAHNQWLKYKEDIKKVLTVKMVYRHLKKELKKK